MNTKVVPCDIINLFKVLLRSHKYFTHWSHVNPSLCINLRDITSDINKVVKIEFDMLMLMNVQWCLCSWNANAKFIFNTRVLHDAPHEMHPNYAKSPNSPKSIRLLTSPSGSKPSWCSSCWKWSPLAPKCVWPHCWLAYSSWWPPPCHFLVLQEIRCGGLFIYLVGVGVGEFACFFFIFLFLLSSSPILHLALIGLVAFHGHM